MDKEEYANLVIETKIMQWLEFERDSYVRHISRLTCKIVNSINVTAMEIGNVLKIFSEEQFLCCILYKKSYLINCI